MEFGWLSESLLQKHEVLQKTLPCLYICHLLKLWLFLVVMFTDWFDFEARKKLQNIFIRGIFNPLFFQVNWDTNWSLLHWLMRSADEEYCNSFFFFFFFCMQKNSCKFHTWSKLNMTISLKHKMRSKGVSNSYIPLEPKAFWT